MNDAIPPYRPTGPEFDPRPVPRPGADPDSDAAETAGIAHAESTAPGPRPRSTDQADAAFGNALEGALDRAAGANLLADLSPDEQQMILRYFPDAPGLALRLYDQKSASRKVDPGAIGARVDLRG